MQVPMGERWSVWHGILFEMYGTGILYELKYREAAQNLRKRGGWHGILFEEPSPTGSRPRDLIGHYKTTEAPQEGTKRERPKVLKGPED